MRCTKTWIVKGEEKRFDKTESKKDRKKKEESRDTKREKWNAETRERLSVESRLCECFFSRAELRAGGDCDEICRVSVCLFGRLLWPFAKEESAFTGAQAEPGPRGCDLSPQCKILNVLFVKHTYIVTYNDLLE